MIIPLIIVLLEGVWREGESEGREGHLAGDTLQSPEPKNSCGHLKVVPFPVLKGSQLLNRHCACP